MIRPFIKWAGGKTRVLPDLLPLLPKGDCLVEPFVGGASVFLNTDYPSYVLADINPDLINCYRVATTDTDALISTAKVLFQHGNNKAEYETRRRSFNYQRSTGYGTGIEQAALFLYLNRHGYNGMCRYNREGGFNIPFGKYRAPYFPEQEIRQFAEKANDTGAIFVCADFKETLRVYAEPDTVIYCDPPYLPVSDTANFTQYHHSAFTHEHHRQLAKYLKHVRYETDAAVVISNSDTPATREIYQHYQFHEVSVSRSLGAAVASRKKARELIGVLTAGMLRDA
ncbi:phage DNA adenine methylase [Pectobacterium atrosepticum SCRI1043]|uniref:Site-specific DNA-methyltransferase (adenine-specific) n=1 Tax=Pectobacterium atrosepticum (strain SCRI 1043 / ATCC BAA-672) TaxID=218491 RepID=Q6D3W4_PECAS|nr:Dam family site-specific DNA-(adenine-N6)-methyltransferase [Pectobacterium atrosepticum]AIK13749.1 phage DNA adenine methylase [Pectobacterium atrosepticum]MCL6315382.1 Dam family site-specific DNA-(adenine-N6)-methyltransferase [Pectobacterium atrosepticum]MCL6320383.1 Dam family site-specific DNA-(adenine-N6)-methyltransferase [Pectobacterium atrosepticum]CAG75530.1 phage DNA adenine methylase [Pectobacterium atrosepticum SCRI1043]